LAFAFIGSLALVASCPAGLAVWAEATDMLPIQCPAFMMSTLKHYERNSPTCNWFQIG
jgi:hypothetical protein